MEIMYGTCIMATIESSSGDWNNGLVHQSGPAKHSAPFRKASNKIKFGGGIGFGTTVHAGNANWMSLMNPYQINATGTLPEPSKYAKRGITTVMASAPYIKKKSLMGLAKNKLTLAARTPFQTGHKMGHGISEGIEGRIQSVGEVMHPEIHPHPEGSFIAEDVSMGTPSSGSFTVPPAMESKKRRPSFQSGSEYVKKHESGFGEVGFKRRGSSPGLSGGKKLRGPGMVPESSLGKRKGSMIEGNPKKSKTLFQGSLTSEQHNVSTKRKAANQLMSEKFKKINTTKLKPRLPKLQIQTKNIGKRFIEKRAESKSAPKKYDQLPELRTRYQLARAA